LRARELPSSVFWFSVLLFAKDISLLT